MPAVEPPCRRRMTCKTTPHCYVMPPTLCSSDVPTESDDTVPDMAAQASSSRDPMFYCIFLKPCWAQLIFVDKLKTMEIRSWRCRHRGRVDDQQPLEGDDVGAA